MAEKGTLRQLQVLIGRNNLPTKVKDDPAAVEDFLDIILDAHVVAATAAFFQMPSIDTDPVANFNDLAQASPENGWAVFKYTLEKFVRQYVLYFVCPVSCSVGQSTQCPQTP